MKKCIVYLCISLISSILFNGKIKATNVDSIANNVKQNECLGLYRQALKYNDFHTAATAVTQYLYAGGDANYQDTLLVLFYNLNNWLGAYKLAGELYAANNKNVTALGLLADISGHTNDTKTSLEWYEKLCTLSPSPFNYYQLAAKQFMLERKLECQQSLQHIIADSSQALRQKVSLEISRGNFEQIPALAAAYNMQGAMAVQAKNTEAAGKLYTKALQIAPNFNIAKQNLENLLADKHKNAPGKK